MYSNGGEDRLPGRLLECRRGQVLEVAGHVHLRHVVAPFARRRAEPEFALMCLAWSPEK